MDLNQYFKSIIRWWWLILLSTTLAAFASYIASLQQPRIYKTTTTLMVGQQILQKSDITGNDFSLTGQLAESYAQIVNRQPILQAAVDSLGLDMGWQDLKWRVNAYAIPRTQLLAIDVQDLSPERAVAIADEVAYQLILQSPNSPQNQEREDRGAFVKNQLDDLERRIETAQTRIKELETELETALSASKIESLQSEISTLEDLINEWRANYNGLLSFLDGGDTPNQLTIIEPAQIQPQPISPDVSLNVALAAAAGFSLAVGAALLLGYLDNTIKSADDLNSISKGITYLGSVVHIDGGSLKGKLINSQSLFSTVTESYRQIRTNIQFTAVDKPAKTIMITSANAGEGKSTSAANLAIVLAQAELRTIIIDADLRKPSLHNLFQIPNLGGLTDLLSSSDKPQLSNHLKSTEIKDLKVITSGPLPPNPSELLGSARMRRLLQELENYADMIIVDTSPILAVTDPIVLSRQVDGVILVTRAKHTRKDAIKQAVERLNQVGANLLGSILNDTNDKIGFQYQYYSHSEQGTSNQSAGQMTMRRWWQRLSALK